LFLVIASRWLFSRSLHSGLQPPYLRFEGFLDAAKVPACPSRRAAQARNARLLRHPRERAGEYAKRSCAMTAGLFDYIEKAFAERF
jgi:hypothetical protein